MQKTYTYQISPNFLVFQHFKDNQEIIENWQKED